MDIDSEEPDHHHTTALFTAAPCPIAWNDNFINKVHTSYPYRGVDQEEQSLEDFAYRKYLDTLWLPNTVAPIEELVHELRRVQKLECKDSSTSSPLFTLVQPILSDSKAIRNKYTVALPGILLREDHSGDLDVEESMALYAWNLERDKSQSTLQWLERFWRRDIQIQILLTLLLISLPNRPKPKKKRKQPPAPTFEDNLGRLLDILQTMSLDEPETIRDIDGNADGGWTTDYCENVIAPLFGALLPEEYQLCFLSLCPFKYPSPSTSPSLGPVQLPLPPANSTFQLSDGLPHSRSETRSRSPSFSESLLDEDLENTARSVSPFIFSQSDSQRRQPSVDSSHERSRSRSTSTFSLDLESRPGVSRGGVATNKSIFARQVDMHRSTKDLKNGKNKTSAAAKAAEKSSKVTAPKRTFGRSATAPIKAKVSAVENPVTLVAETPIAARTLNDSTTSWVEDSPDALLLEPDGLSGRSSHRAHLLVPETPIKGS